MRELLISCLVLLVAVSSVRTSVIYRKYREIEVPVEEIRVQDSVREVVGELRKDVVPVEVDIVEPVVLLKEEVIVPVEAIKNLELNIDAEHAAPALNEIVAKNVHDETPSENDLEEKTDEQKSETDAPQVLAEDEPSINEDDENVLPGLRQTSNTTVRPTLLQQAQQIISNNPIGQFIDSIRRPLTSTPAPGDAVETSTNPNLLQQFQNSVQSFGNQITNALIPNQNPDVSTPRPPTILENFQNVVGSVFRPPSEPNAGTNPTPIGPIQAVISNVQSFFTGNRVTEPSQQSDSAASTDSSKPIDDKIQTVRNSEEVKESSENSDQEIVVGEDSSE